MSEVAAPLPATPDGGREPAVMGVRSAAIWAMGGQYAGFAIQFVVSVVISRLFLTPPEFGLFSLALSAAALVAMLQDFGLSRYISGLPVIDAAEQARCSSVALVFSFVVAGAVCAAAWPLSHYYHQPKLCPLLLIIGSSYLVMPLTVVPVALLARAMEFRRLFVINVGCTLAQGAVGLTLAALGFSSFALAWGTFACALVRGALAQAMRPAPPWPLRFDALGPVLSTGSRLTTLYASGALGTRTPDMIVGKVLGLIAVGLYSRAVSLSDQFRTLISGAIGSVFYPAFARIRDRGEPLGPAYLRVVAGYTAVIWPGMAGLALAAGPIVRLLYGARWAGVSTLLSMIALAEIVLVSLPLVSDLPILVGKLNALLARNFIDTFGSILFLAVFSLWGLGPAAASRIFYALFWYALYFRFMHRVVGFDLRGLLAIYGKSGLASAAAVAPLALAYDFIAPPATIGLAPLSLAVAVGGASWLAVLAITRHPLLDELLGLARSVPLAARFMPLPAAGK